MTTKSAARRNSRWDSAPILDRRGHPKIAALTTHDIEGIFRPLARYRYLPADYLHAFAGGSLDYLINRLNLLSRQPNLYVARPHQQRANAAANHRRLVYELAPKGIALIHEGGIECHRSRSFANFAHELMACQIMASFEIGAREADARLIGWEDILHSKSLPDETRQSPKPWAIPIRTVIDGHSLEARVAADGKPFGVSRGDDESRRYFFCPGIEADCGTEPIDTSDFRRSSIYRKILLYLAIEAQGVFRSHFGFPNMYVPFVTTTMTRLASMMVMLNRITEGAGSRVILFRVFPALTSYEKPPSPSGRMLLDDWQRVGFPPFNFLTS